MKKARPYAALRAIRLGAALGACFSACLTLSTCDLFKVGLGNKVDIDAPVLTFSSHAQNENVNEADFSLAGTVSEDTGLASLIISWSGGSMPATVSGGKWSAQVGPLVEDGRQVFTATATDKAGKSGVANLSLNVDRRAPSVLVSSPQGYGSGRPSQTSYIDIKGEVYDASTISRVEVELLDPSNAIVKTKTADGTNSWSVRFLLGDGPADDLAPLDGAVYRYDVKVTDAAGNVNAYYYHAQDFYAVLAADETFPAMSDIGKTDQAGSGYVDSVPALGYAYLAAHRHGAAAGSCGDFLYDAAGDKPEINLTNVDPGSAVLDNVLSSNVPVTGYVAVGAANYAVDASSIAATIKAYGSADAPTPIPARWISKKSISSSVSFAIDLRSSDADGAPWMANGRYELAISARSQGSASTRSRSVGFIIDSGAPKFTELLPELAEPSFIKRQSLSFSSAPAGREGVRVEAVLSDDNPGAELSSVRAWTGLAPALVPIDASCIEYELLSSSGDGLTRRYGIDIELASGVTDVSLEIEGSDATSRRATASPHYSIDADLPSIDIGLPAAGAWLSGTATTLSGTASDNDQVVRVAYWAGRTGTFPGTAPSAWASADGSSSWTATMNFAAGQGSYQIRAAAIDRAGNASLVAVREVWNDEAYPLLTESSIGGATPQAASASGWRNADFTLAGTASDSYALAAADPLTVSVDGGAAVPVAVAADGSWSYPEGAPYDADANNGVRVFVFTAKDAAGKTSQVERRVTIDTQAPAISFLEPNPALNTAGRPDVKTVNGTVALQGSVTENNSITKLERKLGSEPWASFATELYGFSLSIPTAALPDKADYVVQIRATDAAGNVALASKTMYVDQSSDEPTISFNGVATASAAAANLFLDDAKLQGWAADDDGPVASVSAAVDGDIDTESYASVSSPPTSTSTFFEHSLAALPAGEHRLRIRAADAAGRTKTSDTLRFFVDRDRPAVAISSPASGGYRSASFAMSGTASDANGLRKADLDSNPATPDLAFVEVYAAGPGWERIDASDGTWDYAVPASFVSTGGDGARTVRVRAYDVFGRESAAPAELAFNVDQTPPGLALAPAAAAALAGWQQSRNVSLSGSAWDLGTGASGVVRVEYRINGAASWTALSGTTDWSGVVTFPNGAASSLELRSVDNAGNESAVSSYTVKVDDTDPSLGLDAPYDAATSAETNAAILFSGTIGDNLGLDGTAPLSVKRKKDGLDAPDGAPSLGAGTWSYEFPVDAATNGDDGTWELTFTATDGAGRTRSLTRRVTVETKKPVIAFNNVPPYEGLDLDGDGDFVDPGEKAPAYNGSASLKASIVDDNSIASLYRAWTTAPAAPAYTLNANLTVSGAAWTAYGGASRNAWSESVDTAALGDGGHYLWLLAVDRFGNVGILSDGIRVDQETDRPEIGFVNLSAGGASLGNNLGAGLVLNGTASDDDGIDRDRIFIGIAEDADADGVQDAGETFSFAAVSGKPAASGRAVSFSHDLGSLTKERYYLVQIRVGDTTYAGSIGTEVDWAATNRARSGVERFVLDTQSPDLALGQPNAQYRRGTFALGGTAADEFGIRGAGYGELSVDKNGDGDFADPGEIVALDAAGAWSTTVDTAAFGSDGDKSFLVAVTDGTGRTSSTSFTFKLDTTPPSRGVASPAALASSESAYWHRGVITLGGPAEDGTGSGVASVSIAVTAKGASPLAGDWKAATFGGSAWSYTYDCGAASEGEKTIHLVAADAVGNALAEATRDFGVDLNDPTLSGLAIDGIPYAGLVYLPSKTLRLSGLAADSREIASVRIEEKKPADADYTLVQTIAVSAGVEWSYDRVLDAAVSEGLFLYRVVAYDSAGRASASSAEASLSLHYDRTPPAAPSVTAPIAEACFGEGSTQLKGSQEADSGSGLARVEWSYDSGASWLSAEGTSSWSALLDIGSGSAIPAFQAEGRKTVLARSVDRAGNAGASVSRSFWIDRAAPGASFEAPAANAYVNGSGALAVSVRASDANGIYEIKLRAGDSDFAGADPNTVSQAGDVYSGELPLASILSLSDGNHEIFARVTDNAGRRTLLSRPVIVDKTLPLVAFGSQEQGAIVNKRITISGTASDERSLAGVSLAIYHASTSSWTPLAAPLGTTSWSLADFDTEAYDTADYDTDAAAAGYQVRIRALAADAAQNTNLRTGALRPDATSLRDPALVGSSLVALDQLIVVGDSLRRVSSWASATGTIGWSGEVDTARTSYSLSASILELTIDQASDIPEVKLSNLVTDSVGTAAAVDPGADLVLLPGHGLKAGDAVGFLADELPGGLEAGTTYYLRAASFSAGAFEVATTKTGAKVDIASPGEDLRLVYGGAYPTTLKMVNTVYGVVSDDDGSLSKFEVSLDGSSWTELALSGGTWSYELSTIDGSKNLYFRATDAKSASFSSELRVLRRTLPAKSYLAPPVAFRIDTVVPEIGSAIYVDKSPSPLFDFGDQVELKAGTGVFGGPTDSFALKASATDQNGIKSVRVDITGKDAAAPASNKTVSYPASPAGGNDFATGEIDLSADFADGAATVAVYVTDNSGLSSSATRSITIDNTAPAISFVTPANAEVVNGELTVRGLANDGSGSGLRSLSYRLGLNYASKTPASVDDIFVPSIAFLSGNGPGGTNNKIDTYASCLSGKVDRAAGEERGFTAPALAGNADIAAGKAIKIAGEYRTISSWNQATGALGWAGDEVAIGPNQDYEVYTDVQTLHDASTGADLFILPFVLTATDNAGNVVETAPIAGAGATRGSATSLRHASLVGNPLVAVGQLVHIGGLSRIVTSYAAATGAIGWSGAVPTAATSFTLYPYCLRIDPNGDKPVASIGYPEQGKIYGGKIRVYGSATDDDGVGQVYLQIDCDGDGDFDAADAAGGVDWYNGGEGQLAEGSVNWNRTINAAKEFDPDGDIPETIAVRARAKDVYGTYGPWSAATSFSIDKNVPKIGTAYALKLDPDSDPGNGNELPYEYGMYLAGSWYLRGSIETETALDTVELTGDIARSISWNGSAYAGDTGSFEFVSQGTGGYSSQYRRIDLAIQIACPADTADPLDFELYAEDVRVPALSSAQTMRINVDTKAPTAPTGPAYSLAIPVKQVDYWAKVGGTANDIGSDVDRVEAYFVRRNKDGTASKDRFYNPLVSKAYTERGGPLFSYAETGDYAYMPRVVGSASSRPSTASLVDAAIAGNPMINVGQKIVIGGQTLTISDWDEASGEIRWMGGAVETGVLAYYVDVAIRIDHKDSGTPESHHDTAGGPEVDDDDVDGYAEYLKQTSGTTYSWYVDINSLNIPDGLLDIHYVVYDKAGNRLHRVVSTRVANNPQVLSSLTLGSDLDEDGSYGGPSTGETGSFSLPGAAATGFKVKMAPATLYFAVTGGNGQLAYRLRSGAATVQVGKLRVGGSLQTIELSLAKLKALGEGAVTLGLELWDSTDETVNSTTEALPDDPSSWNPDSWTSPSVSASFGFVVDVADAEAPGASIAPLADASSPSSHIETGPGDPCVSGSVSFTGSASDDQAISALWARLPGFSFPHAAGALASKAIGSGTAVTGLSGGTFAAAGHGLVDGDTVAFTSSSAIANIAAGTTYYVVNAAADGFQVAAEAGGPAIAASGGSGIAFAKPYYRVARYDPNGTAEAGFIKLASGFIVPTAAFAADGWAFAISSSSFSQAGHSVSWRLDWNSAKLAYGAMPDRELELVAEDRGTPGAAARPDATRLTDASLSGKSIPYGTALLVGSTWTFATAFDGIGTVTLHDSVALGETEYRLRNAGAPAASRVDVVPYILDVERKDPFEGRLTLPGRQGRYPLYQGSARVEISGLNLPYAGPATIAGSGFLTIAGKDVSGGVTEADPDRRSLYITVPHGLKSGELLAAALASGLPVASVSGGVFSAAGHGLADGELVSFSSGGSVSGIADYAPYYVRDAGADLFSVAARPGGPAIAASGGSGVRLLRTVGSINNRNDNAKPINVEGAFSDDRVVDIDERLPSAAISPLGRRYGAGGDDAAKQLSSPAAAVYADYAVAGKGHVEYAEHSRIDPVPISGIATDATGLVTAAGHGLEVGEMVCLGYTGAAPTRSGGAAIASTEVFYVRSAPSSSTLTLSESPGGALLTFGSAGNLPTILDAEVSGEVVLHGKAYDDQRIYYIACSITGFDGGGGVGQPFTVYSTTTDLSEGGSGLPVASWGDAWSTRYWKMEDEGATETLLDGDGRAGLGHVLNWKFTWDSSRVAGVAAHDVKVRFTIADYYDFEGSAAFAGGATSLTDPSLAGNGDIAAGQLVLLGAGDYRYLSAFDAATGQLSWTGGTSAAGSSYKVFAHSSSVGQSLDVVPYIKSVTRGGTGLATIRSKYGRYPMQVNEALVTIEGFNLRRSAGDNVFVRAADLAEQAVASITSPAASSTDPQTRLVVTLPALANAWSGQLMVRVNGVYSGNHQNDNDQAYNRELDSGGSIAGTLWDDDRYLDLWRVGQRFGNAASTGDSIDLKHPSMSRNGTSLVGAWSNYGNSAAYYATVGAARTSLFSTYDPPEYTDICYTTEATPSRVVALLENYYGGNSAASPEWGDLVVFINGTSYVIESLGDDYANARNVGDGIDEMLYQFQNPRVAANAAYVYASYYDSFAKCLKYARLTIGGGANTRRCTDYAGYTGGAYVVAGEEVTSLATVPALNVGQFSDIGIDASSSVPVIAYYDTTNAKLMVARGQSANPTAPSQWSKFEATPDGSAIGKYVSMKIEGSTLHLAAYQESEGNLVYIRGSWNGTAYSFTAEPVAVDSIGSVGQWCDIALDAAGRPVVSYIDASNVETYKGLKVANLRGAATDPELQANWEYATVPANAAVSSARTGAEVLGGSSPARGTPTVSIGFAGQYFELVQRYCE